MTVKIEECSKETVKCFKEKKRAPLLTESPARMRWATKSHLGRIRQPQILSQLHAKSSCKLHCAETMTNILQARLCEKKNSSFLSLLDVEYCFSRFASQLRCSLNTYLTPVIPV